MQLSYKNIISDYNMVYKNHQKKSLESKVLHFPVIQKAHLLAKNMMNDLLSLNNFNQMRIALELDVNVSTISRALNSNRKLLSPNAFQKLLMLHSKYFNYQLEN